MADMADTPSTPAPDVAWITKYLGRAYARGAEGPDAYDCWTLFRAVQAELGRSVPPIMVASDVSPGALVELFTHSPTRALWLPIAAPVHGCGVVGHRPLHVGVWLDVHGGGVLHATSECGVIFTRDAVWAAHGFGRKEYLEPAA